MPQLAQIETLKRGRVLAHDHQLVLLAGNTDAAGLPVIYLHGVLSSVSYAALTLPTPALQARRWYSLSLPGHGGSLYPNRFDPHDLTAEAIGATMSAALRKLTQGQPALLVGHSTGGFAALLIAAMAPKLVQGVVCVSGFAQGKWGRSLGWLQHLATVDNTADDLLYGSLFSVRQRVLGWLALRRDPDLAARLSAELGLNTAVMMRPWFSQMPDTDITPLLSQISAPVLAIAGEQDQIVAPSQAALIAEATHGDLRLLPDAAHTPQREQRDAYAQAVDAWLQRHA